MEMIQENTGYLNQFKLHNPFLIKGMQIALEKVVNAINNRKKIIVYGYGDADSVCGTSMLLLLLKYLNADVEYFIPDEMDCDFGISRLAIDNYLKYLGTDLLITVGCGSNSNDEIKFAKSIGIDVIVTDNHKNVHENKNCTVINANNIESQYPFNNLSASGTVFKFCEAISSYYKVKCAYKYIDLAMIGTISSKASIEDENKRIVHDGIIHIGDTNNYGIKALMKIKKLRKINYNTAVQIANSIILDDDSMRKMDNARIAVELFTTYDSYRALQIAKYLNRKCCETYFNKKCK